MGTTKSVVAIPALLIIIMVALRYQVAPVAGHTEGGFGRDPDNPLDLQKMPIRQAKQVYMRDPSKMEFSQPSGPIEYDVKTGAPIRYVPVTNSTDEEVEKGSEPSWGKGGRPAVPPAEDWIDCCCNQTGWKNRSGTNWTPPTVKVQVDVVHGPNDDTAWKLVRFLTFLTMLFDSCLIVILVVALRNVLKKRVADADVRKQDTNGKIP